MIKNDDNSNHLSNIKDDKSERLKNYHPKKDCNSVLNVAKNESLQKEIIKNLSKIHFEKNDLLNLEISKCHFEKNNLLNFEMSNFEKIVIDYSNQFKSLKKQMKAVFRI